MNMIKTLKLTILFLVCSIVARAQLTEWESKVVTHKFAIQKGIATIK